MADPHPRRDPVVAAEGEGADPSGALLDRLAHDLRGPLSPLQTAAYLLRRPDIDPERRDELLAIIDRQTTRLSAMVQEVSDWTRARQSRLVSRRERVSPAMLVDLAATSSGVGVRSEVAAELDEITIDGDSQRLVQMLSTLAGFMRSRAGGGEVAIDVEQVADGIRIDVEVTGSQWTRDERSGLFNGAEAAPFDEGLGMRLMIARAIARAHGGDMLAADARDGSAMIRVLLPLGTAGPEG